MNREIKFKCWNPEMEEMQYAFTIDKLIKMKQQPPSVQNIRFFFDYDKLIWLQFTGLKDVNGKDIYQGDIISVDVLITTEQDEIIGKKPKEDYVLGVVEEYKGSFMAVMVGDEGEKAGCEIEEDCIVLGNIYEHPELLK